MPDHKISADGQSIECHAPEDADCRRRPDCDAEKWESDFCCDHDDWNGENVHPVTSGHDCWMLPWINSTMLDDTYDGPGEPVTTYPGRAVQIEWHDDYCTWKYAGEQS